MTLELAERARLRHLITGIRPDWHEAGTDAALVKLSQTVNDPEQVHHIAIRWAYTAGALKPEGMNRPELIAAATTRTTSRQNGTPRPAGVTECPDHGGNTWRSGDGTWACCYLEQLTAMTDEWTATVSDATGGTPVNGVHAAADRRTLGVEGGHTGAANYTAEIRVETNVATTGGTSQPSEETLEADRV